jgi:hypothetical protein
MHVMHIERKKALFCLPTMSLWIENLIEKFNILNFLKLPSWSLKVLVASFKESTHIASSHEEFEGPTHHGKRHPQKKKLPWNMKVKYIYTCVSHLCQRGDILVEHIGLPK